MSLKIKGSLNVENPDGPDLLRSGSFLELFWSNTFLDNTGLLLIVIYNLLKHYLLLKIFDF